MDQFLLFILLIVSIIISLYAQLKVTSNFNKYSKVESIKGYTGAEVAKLMLDRRGIYDVAVQSTPGSLSDHYDPKSKTVRLSEDVYGETSIAAVSVAAHEVGHAIQHNEEYAFFRFRSLLAPVVQFTNRFIFVLIFIGVFFQLTRLFDIGIIFFALTLLFQIITLPVEFDASRRALYNLEADGFITREEIRGSKKVLGAAALTYVAGTLVSLIQLLRLMAMRNRD
ncbi:MAG: zinc metallopeptidase [Tissierellia bacterium]|nr:zinc metallopeptidase [Tissierellia bacterium]